MALAFIFAVVARIDTVIERRAGDGNRAGVAQATGKAIFLVGASFTTHDPYDPPAPYKARFASQPYDGEIAYADSCVGKLFDEIRKHDLYDETLIEVMADHGGSLGAHGENTHGIFLYDETLHVPLVFKLLANRAAGRRIDTRSRLVDVAPTLLQGGHSNPERMQRNRCQL
jgi:arylsulfatase A-like enzyme